MDQQKDKQITEAKALQELLESISSQKDHLEGEAKALEAEEKELVAKAEEHSGTLRGIAQQMQQKSLELGQIRQAMVQKENEYMAFLEAQPSLVHVLRG
mmetsp:Transcript_63589/g.178953  ORF Transcript_63589/g.178953 Transcript_63589/m.178953 type:complete len:99 (-) Transcript_63589:38-334(-)|eukprot:CAMPEP_0179240620 /NCGR_PEP_ID=MMETSP0797-20121207/16066_1 /TAXON_ID=47934 /ORGANISM="Dinophysis acuminata, Strain DAEP01" /LENGTH=98 /DNA_ID=CAMNT_0020947971 /DNA_START=34 /DNA_END=330 /DNA_ORIENTATION=+